MAPVPARLALAPVPARIALAVAVAVAASACGDDPTGTPPGEEAPEPAIAGRVIAVGGGDVGDLRVVWRPRGGGPGDSVNVGADGSFRIEPSTDTPAGELLVDGAERRRFHPFLYPLHRDSIGALDILLVPRSWTIGAGEYRGSTVDTPLDPVVDDDVAQLGYTYFFGRAEPHADPVRYRLDLAAWQGDALPALVAFDRQDGDHPVTPEDSAAIWAVLDRLETVIGWDLFRPGVADPSWWNAPWIENAGYRPGVIRVVLDPGRWGALLLPTEPHAFWIQDLEGWAAGGLTAFRVEHRRLDGGVLLVGGFEALRLADGVVPWETVLMHEALHILGVGHTCRLASTQGPCMRTSEPSPGDVAYMELLRETLRLAREHGTFLGTMPAVIGERRILLDRPALPTLTGEP
jgi:hypothetical protein